ncbi:hypothetical protein [Nocardioides ungokensis]
MLSFAEHGRMLAPDSPLATSVALADVVGVYQAVADLGEEIQHLEDTDMVGTLDEDLPEPDVEWVDPDVSPDDDRRFPNDVGDEA